MKTIPQKITENLDKLEVGEKIEKKELITAIYEETPDYFITRSFDVHLCAAKKKLTPKLFATKNGFVVRKQ